MHPRGVTKTSEAQLQRVPTPHLPSPVPIAGTARHLHHHVWRRRTRSSPPLPPKISYKLRTDRCRTVMCQADRRVWMQVYNPSPHDKARSYHMFCIKTRLNLAFAGAAEPGQRLLLFPAASTAMQLHHKGCLSLVADTRHPSWTQAREKLAGQLRLKEVTLRSPFTLHNSTRTLQTST